MKYVLSHTVVAAILWMSLSAMAQETTATPVEQKPAEPVVVAPAVEEEAPNYPAAWFRVDTDILSTQLWFGATWALSDSVGLATDIYVVGTLAEFDLGVTLTKGAFSITPMAGIAFDFGTGKFASLVAPQLYTIVNGNKLYFESWIQLFFNDMFKAVDDSMVVDQFYTRNFLLWKFNDMFALGPAFELTWNMRNADEAGVDAIGSLPVGLMTNLNYGEKNTLGLFLGYETMSEDGDPKLAGRFTFVRNW